MLPWRVEFEFNLLGRQQLADNTQGHSPKDAYMLSES